jgi:hypothetical protein
MVGGEFLSSSKSLKEAFGVFQLLQIRLGLGTNRMELRLWKSANLAPDMNSPWYRDLGRGMGPTLNIAARLNALYAHRPSYLGFQLGLLE